MRKNSSMVLPALLALSLMGFAVGCGDDDDGNGNGTPTTDADTPPATSECLERLEEQSPETPAECNECMCDNCEDELDACDEVPGCQDKVECAQEAIGDGTCPEPAEDNSNLTDVIDCLETECESEATEPEGILLLCINNNDCAELCIE